MNQPMNDHTENPIALVSAELLAACELILKRGYAIEASDHQQILDAVCKARGIATNESRHGIRAILDKASGVDDYKRALSYVTYQRLPLGDQVFDHLPEHWKLKITQLLSL